MAVFMKHVVVVVALVSLILLGKSSLGFRLDVDTQGGLQHLERSSFKRSDSEDEDVVTEENEEDTATQDRLQWISNNESAATQEGLQRLERSSFNRSISNNETAATQEELQRLKRSSFNRSISNNQTAATQEGLQRLKRSSSNRSISNNETAATQEGLQRLDRSSFIHLLSEDEGAATQEGLQHLERSSFDRSIGQNEAAATQEGLQRLDRSTFLHLLSEDEGAATREGLQHLDRSFFNQMTSDDEGSHVAAIGRSAGDAPSSKLLQGRLPKKSDVGRAVEIEGTRYVLEEKLGAGTMGTVFKCKSAADGSDVAIKFQPIPNSRCRAITRNEAFLSAEVTAALKKEGLENHIPAYLAGDEEKRVAARVVMSYRKAWSLQTYISMIEERPDEYVYERMLDLLRQMTLVFREVSKICVHRDLSVENVMVDQNTKEFILIDFGMGVRTDIFKEDCEKASIAGSPRFWTLGLWEQLIFGEEWKRLRKENLKIEWKKWHDSEVSVKQEYQDRVDHFGLGILTLYACYHTLPTTTDQNFQSLYDIVVRYFAFAEGLDLKIREFQAKEIPFRVLSEPNDDNPGDRSDWAMLLEYREVLNRNIYKAATTATDKSKIAADAANSAPANKAAADDAKAALDLKKLLCAIRDLIGIGSKVEWKDIHASVA